MCRRSAVELRDYPRPKDDTGIGVHWSAGFANAIGLGEIERIWLPELAALGVKWVKVANHDGALRFVDVSQEAGVAVSAIGFSAAAGDVNGDGRPDLYVSSYNRYGQVTPDVWYKATNGTPNLLFVSQPGGGYREEARKWGVDDRRWSYAAQFLDVDEDGKLDLYVVNDFGEKALYMRRGDRFVDEAGERGVLDTGNGMGVSFGDYNNDGRLDLHVTNMSSTAGNRILGRLFPGATPDQNVLKKLAAGNALYENLGGGRFRERREVEVARIRGAHGAGAAGRYAEFPPVKPGRNPAWIAWQCREGGTWADTRQASDWFPRETAGMHSCGMSQQAGPARSDAGRLQPKWPGAGRLTRRPASRCSMISAGVSTWPYIIVAVLRIPA